MGLSLIDDEENPGIFPTSPVHTEKIAGLLKAHNLPFRRGRFITVSTVTGTEERARSLYRRFRPLCESMEGASVGHISRLFGVDYCEIRAISNPVGRRQRHRWKTPQALKLLHEGLSMVLENTHKLITPQERRGNGR